jgi:hypothetical protein
MKKTIQGQIHPNQGIKKILEAISRGCQKVYNHIIPKYNGIRNGQWTTVPSVARNNTT